MPHEDPELHGYRNLPDFTEVFPSCPLTHFPIQGFNRELFRGFQSSVEFVLPLG
jgi:hypothetical protein